jgi:hypothetical protein
MIATGVVFILKALLKRRDRTFSCEAQFVQPRESATLAIRLLSSALIESFSSVLQRL